VEGSIKDLVLELEILLKISNEEFLNKLEDRKIKELYFHDRDRDQKIKNDLDENSFEKYYGNAKYYRTIKRSTEYVENWIKKKQKEKYF